MNNALKSRFPLFQDERALVDAIHSVCAKYGKVKSLRVLPAARDGREGGRQCLCLLQLDSAEAQAALRSELKVFVVDNEIAFVADVHEEWNGPSI
jgi:hypothetical protein